MYGICGGIGSQLIYSDMLWFYNMGSVWFCSPTGSMQFKDSKHIFCSLCESIKPALQSLFRKMNNEMYKLYKKHKKWEYSLIDWYGAQADEEKDLIKLNMGDVNNSG